MVVDLKRVEKEVRELVDAYEQDELDEWSDDTSMQKAIKGWADEMHRSIPALMKDLKALGVFDAKNPGTRVFDDDIYMNFKGFNRYSDSDLRNQMANYVREALVELGYGDYYDDNENNNENEYNESTIRSSIARLLGESTKKKTKKESEELFRSLVAFNGARDHSASKFGAEGVRT